MSEHYGCAVLPTHLRKPKDKAKVEVGVLIAKRWILAVLRHRTFYRLAKLNTAIRECLERLNTHPMHRVGKSRRELFAALEQPNVLLLLARPYKYAEWYKAKVQLNYHIEVDQNYYSVPIKSEGFPEERLPASSTAGENMRRRS